MPRGDGLRSTGGGAGRGMRGQGKTLIGRGLGPSAECICPNCGAKIAHKPGVPCAQEKCPKCGTPMVRA